MQNKKGSILIYGMMLGLTIIILALALAPAINESTSQTMNQTSGDTLGLDCSNTSISNYDKAACVAVDLGTNFYFVVGLILIGGGIIGVKIIFS